LYYKKIALGLKIKLGYLEGKRQNLLAKYLEAEVKNLTAKKISNLTTRYIKAGVDGEVAFYRAIQKFYPKKSQVLFEKILRTIADDQDLMQGIIKSFFEKENKSEYQHKYLDLLKHYFKGPIIYIHMAKNIKIGEEVKKANDLWLLFEKAFEERIEYYIAMTSAYIRKAS